ncbi:MAG: hypothetical protein ACU84H_08175 [Gammaproteobacteria bacterium]
MVLSAAVSAAPISLGLFFYFEKNRHPDKKWLIQLLIYAALAFVRRDFDIEDADCDKPYKIRGVSDIGFSREAAGQSPFSLALIKRKNVLGKIGAIIAKKR